MRIYPASIIIFFCSIVVFGFTSCSSTRHVPQGEYLLHKNVIKVEQKINWKKIKKNTGDNRSAQEQLLSLAQKPNRKTLGIIKFNLSVYNFFYTEKLSRFKQWMMNTVGEPPVIFDSTLMETSAKKMQSFLNSKGYFNSKVLFESKLKKRKATVRYIVTPGILYTIDTVQFPAPNNGITSIIDDFKDETLLRENDPLDFDKMEEEQTRILKDLQNWGYYKFSKSDIYFTLDTTRKQNQARIAIHINAPSDKSSQKKYYIRNVTVYPDYEPGLEQKDILLDTLEFNHLLFLYRKMNLRPQVLHKVIFISKGDAYSRKKYDYSISRIADLGVYNFVNIRFKDAAADSLDCSIYLTPAKLMAFNTELEVSNIEDNLGSALRFSFVNRNLRHRATRFEATASGGIEIPIANIDSLLYNASTSFSFYIPRFLLLPIGEKRLSQNYNEKTKISLSANLIRQNKVYSLINYNFSFGWDWKESRQKRHIVNPLFITLANSFNLSSSFKERLNDDPLLAQSFDDLLITGANYNFIYSNNEPGKNKNFTVIKVVPEVTGWGWLVETGLNALSIPTQKNENGEYLFIQLPFSNFAKVDVDFRRYLIFDKNRQLVGRVYGGIGTPYLNSKVLPYIKQFYAGGPNDIRAWRIRALGPGSYNLQELNTGEGIFYNQTGDIKLQANLEYRFGIISFIKGAFFADAGNIWNLKKDTSKVGAEFQFDRFYKEFALGAGFGLRLDFTFMVLRFDLAVPLHNPALPEGSERWTYNQNDSVRKWWESSVLNIAIGYPFN